MNEISKELKCVVIRGGIELWVEADKIEQLASAIERGGLLRIDGNLANAKDVVGVYDAKVMEEVTRRKNGQWKCESGYWHNRNEECAHKSIRR